MTKTYRVMDLCGGEGGAAHGYALAGCEVVGFDIKPQPRYPYEFHQADALYVLRDLDYVRTFDFIHASWPCQAYSPLNALPSTKNASEHPDLLAPGREAMNATGLPWVIENVMAAPLDKARSITLCGGMFGLRTYRHRRFEPSPGLPLVAPAHPRHVIRTATKRRREMWDQGWHVSITGSVGTYLGPEAMGIDWMTSDGLCQAIPPAYTEWIGAQVMERLTATSAAA